MENVTLGQKRVQRNFNPSANPTIENLKDQHADLIDKLEIIKDDGNAREIEIAQTYIETACMYAVKSLFV
jgi:Holliday junction resolvase RusA-like endonuclease